MERIPRPQPQELEMVRTVLAATGGVRLVYTTHSGDYIGEITILGVGSDAMQAMTNDLHAFVPSFIAQQNRMAIAMPFQKTGVA